MPEENADETPPQDRCKAVYFILLVHGIGMLMPWNLFINARSYFVDYKLSKNYTGEETEYATYFLHSVGFASQIPNLIFNWVNVFIHTWGSITPRIVLTLSVEIVIIIITIILTMINTSGFATAFFWSTMVSIVIINTANGVYQNTIFGIAAELPSKYPGAVILGCNVCGTLISISNLVTNLTASNKKTATFYYFLISFFILLACLSTYFVSLKIKFFRHHVLSMMKAEPTTGSGQVTKIPYRRIFKSAVLQLFNLFCVFFVSLSIFPELQANIRKSDSNFIIPEKHYMQVMCFLTFNTSAMIGCILGNLIKWPGPKLLLFPVLLRVLFIPFFFFCNYHPVDKVRNVPVLISNDWVFWVAGILLGFTSGYLSTKGLIYTAEAVETVYMNISGMFGAAVLVSGIVSGVLFSMIFPSLAGV